MTAIPYKLPVSQAEEFDMKAKEIDLQIRVGLVSPQIEGKGTTTIMCEHKDMGVVHFAHGLCRGCYDEVNKHLTCFQAFHSKRTLA